MPENLDAKNDLIIQHGAEIMKRLKVSLGGYANLIESLAMAMSDDDRECSALLKAAAEAERLSVRHGLAGH